MWCVIICSNHDKQYVYRMYICTEVPRWIIDAVSVYYTFRWWFLSSQISSINDNIHLSRMIGWQAHLWHDRLDRHGVLKLSSSADCGHHHHHHRGRTCEWLTPEYRGWQHVYKHNVLSCFHFHGRTTAHVKTVFCNPDNHTTKASLHPEFIFDAPGTLIAPWMAARGPFLGVV